jgi:hypothetical protein
MRQWMLRITAYAERLLDDLEGLDWPASVLDMQRHWIGRSDGAEVDFALADAAMAPTITVFTTRPDTLFGATYMVLAPEHPLVAAITTREQRAEVSAYVEKTPPVAASASARPRPPRAKDRRVHRRVRHQPGQRRARPGVDLRLRADGLRHRRDHGGARPRRARPRVRHGDVPADRRGRRRRRASRSPRPPSASRASPSTPASSTACRPRRPRRR